MALLETPLCKLAYKYKTDKCPRIKHFYTPFYYEFLKDKKIKTVLEFGIGYPRTMEHTGLDYKAGASLRMWRDFFPKAQIYGADIKEECMFEEERIKTFICDEKNPVEVADLIIDKIPGEIDLVIDDADHFWKNQAFLAWTMLPLLKKDVIYIIEDVGWPQHIKEYLHEYECHVPRLGYRKNKRNHIPKDRLLLVKNQ